MFRVFLWIIPVFLFLSGCGTNTVIVNDVEEREANEIVVFLAARNIDAKKIPLKTSQSAGDNTAPLYSIAVDIKDTTNAMAILNQNGLPRKKGTNLLELFAKQGLMTTEKEETIRYQAGLEQQLANMIRKIDGVLDADVQLSFPTESNTGAASQTPPQRLKAAVYVKHQGIVDDPNSHLISKFKRLVAASVAGLDINDVTVIADRSRFSDVMMGTTLEGNASQPKDYTTIWSIVISESVSRFQLFFFSLIAANLLFLLLMVWIIWKCYSILRDQGGVQSLLARCPSK